MGRSATTTSIRFRVASGIRGADSTQASIRSGGFQADPIENRVSRPQSAIHKVGVEAIVAEPHFHERDYYGKEILAPAVSSAGRPHLRGFTPSREALFR